MVGYDAYAHLCHSLMHFVLDIEEHAYGTDNYHSLSRVGSNMTAAGGIGYTIVDSIDTIMLMGLEDEYERARSWIETDLSFDRDAAYNTFEVGNILVFTGTCLTLLTRPQSVFLGVFFRHITSPPPTATQIHCFWNARLT